MSIRASLLSLLATIVLSAQASAYTPLMGAVQVPRPDPEAVEAQARRLEAYVLVGANLVARAASAYEGRHGRLPTSVGEIVADGILPAPPPPGNGTDAWVIDPDARSVAISVDAVPGICGHGRPEGRPRRLTCSSSVRPGDVDGDASFVVYRIPPATRTEGSF